MTAHTPGPWVIDNRSTYAEPAGGHQAPLRLGAVVAECPTAFGGHTIRAPHTIGKPCPTKEAMDAEGLANAHLCKAGPELLRELKRLVRANEEWNADVQQVIGRMPHWTDGYLDDARAAIASAEGRDEVFEGAYRATMLALEGIEPIDPATIRIRKAEP